MMTGMICGQNIIRGRNEFDVWQVNQDAEYHEAGNAASESGASGLRMVPEKVVQAEQ
jgi:hypothetical protein